MFSGYATSVFLSLTHILRVV